jgi:hypothetical protein
MKFAKESLDSHFILAIIFYSLILFLLYLIKFNAICGENSSSNRIEVIIFFEPFKANSEKESVNPSSCNKDTLPSRLLSYGIVDLPRYKYPWGLDQVIPLHTS